MIRELGAAVARGVATVGRGVGAVGSAGRRLVSRWAGPGAARTSATTSPATGSGAAPVAGPAGPATAPAVAAPPDRRPAPPFRPAAKVADLTGTGISDQWEVGGTDLGAPALTPDGRLLLVFGDTFSGPASGDGTWRAPVALYADPSTLTTGLSWTGPAPGRDGTDDRVGQLVPQDHWTTIRGFMVSTQLPSDVVLVGNVLYLQVMACENLGNVHFTELYASRDGGRTWSSTGCWWPGDHWNGWFQNLSFCPGDDGYLYCVSTGFQRDKGLMLSRVATDRITDRDAWEPWGWTPADGWTWGGPPAIVLPGAYGEQSLRRIDDRWVLSAFDNANVRIDVRLLSSPTDDMTAAPVATVARHVAWDQEDHARGLVSQLYAGYVLPGSTFGDLHLVISQWHTDPPHRPYRSMQFWVDLSTLARQNP